MAYTEIKKRNKNEYFYRVISIRDGAKVSKRRVYLGKNLKKSELAKKENSSDKCLKSIKRDIKFNRIKEKIVEVLKKNNIKKAGIFGSYARGDYNEKSDIDILIQPTKKMSLFDMAGIRDEISSKGKLKVDLLTYKGISPFLKERILNEEARII